MSALREDQIEDLRQIFNLFDSDGDGLLEVEEIGAIWAACGTVLTEAEVLDLATELKPDLRRLPFEEFVNMMCRPMVGRQALEAEISDTFSTFSGGGAHITPPSLSQALAELGHPTEGLVGRLTSPLHRPCSVPSPPTHPPTRPSPLTRANCTRQSEEMISEAGSHGEVSHAEFCAMAGLSPGAGSGAGADKQ